MLPGVFSVLGKMMPETGIRILQKTVLKMTPHRVAVFLVPFLDLIGIAPESPAHERMGKAHGKIRRNGPDHSDGFFADQEADVPERNFRKNIEPVGGILP